MYYSQIMSLLSSVSGKFGCISFLRGLWLYYLLVGASSLSAGNIDYPLPSNPYALDGQLSCGPRCAAFFLDYFGREVSYTEVLEKCPPGPVGASLEQVKDLLEKYGVYTLGFSDATAEKLKRLRYPAIMHLNNKDGTGHFLVLLGWEQEKQAFRVYSPPSFYGHTSEKELGDRLSGFGLAVSDRSLPPIENLLFEENQLWPYLGVLLLSIILFVWVATSSRFSRKRGESCQNTEGNSRTTNTTGVPAVLLACLLPLANSGCSDNTGMLAKALTAEREIDLGRIIAGPPIKHTFVVLNRGAQPFRVKNIRKSCSCQTAIYDQNRVVNPGEYAKLTVEVPTKGAEGFQVFYFVLETDSNENGWNKIPLSLKAQLAAKIKPNPSQISFGTIPIDKGAKARLMVISAEGNVCESFRGFELNQKIKTVLLSRRNDAPTGMIELEVEIPRGAAIGDVNATIVLKFDDKEVPRIDVPVVGRIEGDIRPVPQVVMMSSGNTSRRIVELMSRNGIPFSVTTVNSDDGIKIEPISAEQDIHHRYAVFVEDGLRPGDYSITFTTDQPMQTTLTLPVIVHE
jgi:hypothetical protein